MVDDQLTTLLPLLLAVLGYYYYARYARGDRPDAMSSVRPHAAWLQHATARPWEAAEWSAEQLDTEGLAFRLPNFLTVAECDHVINEIAPIAGFHIQSQDRLHRSTPLVGANLLEPEHSRRYRDALNWTTMAALGEGPDETLASIERRIERLTGIPFHDLESPLMLGVTEAGTLSASERSASDQPHDSFVVGLHHDHNQRPDRTVTVIMYLTAEEESSGLIGGGTLFPCLRPRDAEDVDDAAAVDGHATPQRGMNASRRAPPWPAVCDELVTHYRRQHFYLNERMDGQSSATMSDALTRRAQAQCAGHGGVNGVRGQHGGADAHDGYGLLMRPRLRGDALLFLSVVPEDGRAVRHTWHMGCPVRGGTKYSLQKCASHREEGCSNPCHGFAVAAFA